MAVSAFLDCEGLPAELVMAPDPELAVLPWPEDSTLRIERRAAVDGDKTSVSLAFAGIAETGTLVLLSGPHGPTTLSFLPDTHIVVLRADPSSVPTRTPGINCGAWFGMPRTVNFITGPSRSADIEQTVQMGAFIGPPAACGAGGRLNDASWRWKCRPRRR